MSLEKDINQPKFRSEYQKSIVNIVFTFNWLTEQLKDIIERQDITMQQFNILRILRGSSKPLSTMQIRERMLDKMSDTSRIVDRLVLKSFSKKVVSKNDKRLVDVSITEKGKKILALIDVHEPAMDNIMATLSVSEAKTLNKLLDKVRKSN
jgi:DNA-binding MarR family transcriptional regulator